MEWTDEMIKAASKPVGELGKTVAEEMNRCHYDLWQWGLSNISLSGKSTILDIGCGGGGTIKLLHKLNARAKIFAIDYSRDMVVFARQFNYDLWKDNICEIRFGSVSDIPYPDDIFDLVTAFECDYFWPDPKNDLNEVRRVLKSGGVFLIVDECYVHRKFLERNKKRAELLGAEFRSPEEYHDWLAEAGFTNIKIIEAVGKNWITVISKKPSPTKA